MSLQDRLDAFKADFEGGRLAFKPPPEVIETMYRATNALVIEGLIVNACPDWPVDLTTLI